MIDSFSSENYPCLEAVFISDLHLHPQDSAIKERFDSFIAWATSSAVKSIYILGDFFHVWAGDDSIDEWSIGIAEQLSGLSKLGISLYFMHGNRDFLLGKNFAKRAGWTILPEPTVVQLGKEKILLVHGDRYCTKDKAHKRFRALTRNFWFPKLFLSLPLSYRVKLVNKVRQLSQENQSKSIEEMNVDSTTLIKHMNRLQVQTLIHGHTHKPGLTIYKELGKELKHYVLSDWDDSPKILCYYNTNGIKFYPCAF